MVFQPKSPYGMALPEDKPLLFWKDEKHQLCLCIPHKMAKQILELAHDKENHYGLAKTYAHLTSAFYFPKLLKLLKLLESYIAHCPKCAINRTLRHKPYGDAQVIETPNCPLHTITMDFILSLPPARCFAHGDELFDTILTLTDKFTKAIKLVIGKGTYNAADWARRYWQSVYPDWGFPSAIISDRDPKFLSLFWTELFRQAKMDLLTSTAYHPQMDGQSERTNQSVEIALRYYIGLHQNDWPEAIDTVQAAMNTAMSATTKKSPFQLLYGFNPRHVLELVADSGRQDDWVTMREIYRKEATTAIKIAQTAMAAQMDKKLKPLSLAVGDKAYLRLHHGYSLPSTVKAKISQQRVGPFEVTRVIGKNAYQLALPPLWKVWPVISAVFLEPAMKGFDPFERTIPPPPSIVQEGDTPDNMSYEVSAVVKKRFNKRSKSIEYLLRWKGYGAEHDQWFPEDELEHCQDVVRDYEHATGNTEWRSKFLANKSPATVEFSVDPDIDLNQSETPSNITIQRDVEDQFSTPAQGPVTLLRRSTRLQSKA